MLVRISTCCASEPMELWETPPQRGRACFVECRLHVDFSAVLPVRVRPTQRQSLTGASGVRPRAREPLRLWAEPCEVVVGRWMHSGFTPKRVKLVPTGFGVARFGPLQLRNSGGPWGREAKFLGADSVRGPLQRSALGVLDELSGPALVGVGHIRFRARWRPSHLRAGCATSDVAGARTWLRSESRLCRRLPGRPCRDRCRASPGRKRDSGQSRPRRGR